MKFSIAVQSIFAVFVFAVGIANLIWVHFVPAISYMVAAVIFTPIFNNWLRLKYNFAMPIAVKIILAIAIILFTFGVSDLGDMIDKL